MNTSNLRKVIAPRIGTEHFRYWAHSSGFGGSFSIPRSKIEALNGFDKAYQDGNEVGLILVSHKTGNEALFIATSFETGEDGKSVSYVLLECVFSSYRKPGNEKLQHVNIKIYNS